MNYQETAIINAGVLRMVLDLPGVEAMCVEAARDGQPACVFIENGPSQEDLTLAIRLFPFHCDGKSPDGAHCQAFAKANPEKAFDLLKECLTRVITDANRPADSDRYHFGRDFRDSLRMDVGGRETLLHLALDRHENGLDELTLCAASER